MEQTRPIRLDDGGGALLVSLLFKPPLMLGCGSPPSFVREGNALCVATGLLGRGATAAGYPVKGTHADCGFLGREAVAKVFLPDPRRMLLSPEPERAVLTAVQCALDGVDTKSLRIVRLATEARVQALGVQGSGETLLLQPLGTTFYIMPSRGLYRGSMDANTKLVTAAEFCDCVRALVLLHRCGYVHQDVHPRNFFRGEGCVFILGDLGAATPIGRRYEDADGPQQALMLGPWAAIKALKEQADTMAEPVSLPYSCADDFEQVARAVYAAITKMDIPLGGHIDVLAAAWESVTDSVLLNALLQAAKAAGEAVQRDVEGASQAASSGSTAASDGGAIDAGSAASSAGFEAGDVEALDASGGGLAPLSDTTKSLVRAFCALITREYGPTLSRFPGDFSS